MSEKEKNPAEQGEYKGPPREYQWKPGQSGNPKGPPKRRTNLWVYFCKYMEMDNKQLEKLKGKELTQSQQAALIMVENITKGKGTGSQKLALEIFNREEGKAESKDKLDVTTDGEKIKFTFIPAGSKNINKDNN